MPALPRVALATYSHAPDLAPDDRLLVPALAESGIAAAAAGWVRFVLKPSISASSYEMHRLSTPLDDAARATVARVTALGVDGVDHDGAFLLIELELIEP